MQFIVLRKASSLPDSQKSQVKLLLFLPVAWKCGAVQLLSCDQIYSHTQKVSMCKVSLWVHAENCCAFCPMQACDQELCYWQRIHLNSEKKCCLRPLPFTTVQATSSQTNIRVHVVGQCQEWALYLSRNQIFDHQPNAANMSKILIKMDVAGQHSHPVWCRFHRL